MFLGPLQPHSPQAQVMATLFIYILILAAVIFLLVGSLVGYSLLRYRARPGASEPRQNFGSRTMEIIWTVIPLFVVGVIFIVTVRAMAFIDAPRQPSQPPDPSRRSPHPSPSTRFLTRHCLLSRTMAQWVSSCLLPETMPRR
jgi:heme/copper-type cytochrome/quinol oxidase subunit 2